MEENVATNEEEQLKILAALLQLQADELSNVILLMEVLDFGEGRPRKGRGWRCHAIC
jgi:hypothetical protein